MAAESGVEPERARVKASASHRGRSAMVPPSGAAPDCACFRGTARRWSPREMAQLAGVGPASAVLESALTPGRSYKRKRRKVASRATSRLSMLLVAPRHHASDGHHGAG